MANELAAQSSSRSGATVLWITLHTAEGATDAFPADPARDRGSAQALLRFFQSKDDRSCHAIADDDVLLDDLVPYDRSAWTLRNGNRYSDNLEMCGLASWSRAEWLTHRGMLTQAARWVASRCKARGIRPVRLSVAQVAAKSGRGYIDHNTYTKATGDGTHWDVGPNFPWDVFEPMVTAAFNGTTQEGSFMSLSDAEEQRILKAADQILATAAPGTTGPSGTWESTLAAARLTFNSLNELSAQVKANQAIVGDDEAKLTAKLDEVKAAVDKLAPPVPPSA